MNAISAIDVTNPKNPHSIWQGNITSHGMSLSPDGNRAYLADPGGELAVLDTSQIQARRSNPQTREVSRLTWKAASIPQNAIPFTVRGRPYLMETDEYTAGTSGGGNKDEVGAARIIDISDERHPRVVSNLRLQVNQPDDHKAAANDPGAMSPVQGYAGHYCDVSTPVNPKLVACSFIVSGLRVFDISKLTQPKEIAYHVAPTRPRFENGYMQSAFAMSKPTFAPERREVWYTDGATGFNVLRIDRRVWPAGAGEFCRAGCASGVPGSARSASACRSARCFAPSPRPCGAAGRPTAGASTARGASGSARPSTAAAASRSSPPPAISSPAAGSAPEAALAACAARSPAARR